MLYVCCALVFFLCHFGKKKKRSRGYNKSQGDEEKKKDATVITPPLFVLIRIACLASCSSYSLLEFYCNNHSPPNIFSKLDSKMELSNVGDRVFAAERILKKRSRRASPFLIIFSSVEIVSDAGSLWHGCHTHLWTDLFIFLFFDKQGHPEYLVKWKGWSNK